MCLNSFLENRERKKRQQPKGDKDSQEIDRHVKRERNEIECDFMPTSFSLQFQSKHYNSERCVVLD